MSSRRFENFAELKSVFGSADAVDKFVVFDIGGNKYRLVAHVRYATDTNMGRAYVREVMTHSQYDGWSSKQ